jgi:hypothetical protein
MIVSLAIHSPAHVPGVGLKWGWQGGDATSCYFYPQNRYLKKIRKTSYPPQFPTDPELPAINQASEIVLCFWFSIR